MKKYVRIVLVDFDCQFQFFKTQIYKKKKILIKHVNYNFFLTDSDSTYFSSNFDHKIIDFGSLLH